MLAYTFYEFDNRVRRYAETLAADGNHVDVIALRINRQQAKVECINHVKVYRIQRRVNNEKFKLSYLIKMLIFFCRSFIFLTRKYLIERYNIIHVHSPPDFEVFATLLPKIKGAKIILDIHDIMPEFYKSKFNSNEKSLIYKALLSIERFSIAFSDHTLISNHIWEKRLLERSAHSGKITTIINFPDERIFRSTVKQKNVHKCILMYPGTLNWHQGLDIALEAFEIIKDLVPHAELHIHGDGPSKPYLANRIKQLQLEHRVLLKGSVPINEIAKCMAYSDLGIVPKRNDSFGGEAFSTKTLEFMQLGVPIIVSKTKIDSFYFDDSIVRFFKPGDHKDLAEAMLELITNKQARISMAERASEFVIPNRWGAKKQIYLNLIDNLNR